MFQKTIHDGTSFPEKYFFFNNTNSLLRVDTETLQYKNISITKGYTIMMWIRAEQINLDTSNKRIIDSSLLYYIHTSKNTSFEVYLKNKSIFYRIVNDLNSQVEGPLHHIIDIEFGKWTFLVFSHKPWSFLQKSELTVWKDSSDNFIVKSVEYPNIKGQKIISIGFFKDFTGQVSNLIMMRETIFNQATIKDFSNYLFGFYNERNIRIFKDVVEKESNNSKYKSEMKQAYDSILFMYSPCRMKKNIIKDIFNNINAEIITLIEDNILVGGVGYDDSYFNSISFFGGIFIFLPIFEFFMSPCFKSTHVFEEALNLLIRIIDCRDIYKVIRNIENDTSKNVESKFFSYLSTFFEKYDKFLFSREIVRKLLQIVEMLINKCVNNDGNSNYILSKSFFKNILFNPKIFTKFESDIQIEMWKQVSEIYLKKITIMNSFFDARDIFEVIIKVYDNDINVYCCEDHLKMLCEKYSKDSNDNQILISHPPLSNKISHLFVMLEGVLTTSKIIAVDQIKKIIPFLAYEISPCIQKSFSIILQKLISNSYMKNSVFINNSGFVNEKRINSNSQLNNINSSNPLLTIDNITRIKYITTFIKYKGLEHLLFISGISTLDVRIECIKIFDLLVKMKNYIIPLHIEEELIPFIVHSIFPIKTPIKKNNLNLSSIENNGITYDNNYSLGNFFENREAKIKRDTYKLNENYILSNKRSNKSHSLDPDLEERVNLLNTETTHFRDDEMKNFEAEFTMINTNLNNEFKINKLIDIENNNRIESRNPSLSKVEEVYWRFLSDYKYINKLNLSDSYYQDYSNCINDEYLEIFYNNVFKWLTGKMENITGESNQENESDDIIFAPALDLLMKIIMHAKIVHKQKCLVDILILTKYNKQNCRIFIKNKYFYQWLLDLIFPFQILLLNNIKTKLNLHTGLAATIIELGIKIHTNIIINSVLYDQENFSSASMKKEKNDLKVKFEFLTIWFYKLRKTGIIEGKASDKLMRALLLNLVNAFNSHLLLISPNYRFSTWNNFIKLTFIVYEFAIFSNFDKKILEKKINFDLLEKNEILAEIIQNLNYDFEGVESNYLESSSPDKQHSLEIKNRVSMMDIWLDKELLILLYDSYKVIWHENVFKLEKISILTDELKFAESLVNKLIFENKPNFFIEDLLILLKTSTNRISFENSKSVNLLRAILNIIIIIIRLSEDKHEVAYWVKELEKFTLFVLSAAENSRVDAGIGISDSILSSVRESCCQTILIVFNFLIDELNSPRRREFTNELIDVFLSTLRFLFIFFTYALEKVNLILISSKRKSPNIFFYIENIKNTFFVAPNYSYHLYSPCWKLHTEFFLDKYKTQIFSIEDIKSFQLDKFVDIPEIFNTEKWTYALHENNNSFKVIKNQFNFDFFEKLIMTSMLEADNVTFNYEICYKEKSFINKVYKSISNLIKDSLVTIENKFKFKIYKYFVNKKSIEYDWKSIRKEMFQWRGKWSNLDRFIKQSQLKIIKYKIANHYTSSISKPFLFAIFDIKNYLPNFSKYNPIVNSLFLDNHNISRNVKKLHARNRDSVPALSENYIFNKDELKVKQTTNKSFMHYNKLEYSDFVEKYLDIEKLLKWYHLYYNFNYNKNILNLPEMFINQLKREKLENEKYFEVCLVKITHHIKGRLIIYGKEIYFLKSTNVEKCVESLFTNTREEGNEAEEKPGEKLFFHFKIPMVKQIYKRRYFYKKTSAEVFLFNNKSYYFYFLTQSERDNFCKIIYENSNSKENPFLFEYHSDLKKNTHVITKLLDEWSNWRISNFDLLMNINILSGRSFHDLTQYPILPWVISDYTSNDIITCKSNKKEIKVLPSKSLRDLSKPIGALGTQERIALFMTTFEETANNHEEMGSNGNYHYNTHYSNPFYVTNFLARLFPFTSCAIELQGESFDIPSRQFISVAAAFKNSLTQATDIRELIPELYYLPEMFLNLNNINFGKIESTFVNDVDLPEWCKDPYRFVIANRNILESEEVSSKINDWIDLIFGYKQRGKEAENAMNLFWKFTYEDEVDIDLIYKRNKDDYNSYISKIYFGQCPTQILNKPHITRLSKESSKSNKLFIENQKHLRLHNSTSEAKNQYKLTLSDVKKKMMIKIKSLENDRIICVYNNGVVQVMKVDDTPYTLSRLIFIKEKEVIISETESNSRSIEKNDHEEFNLISEVDEDIMKDINQNQPVKIVKNGKIIIKGGYYEGKFLLFNMNTEEIKYMGTDEDSKVTVIESDESEKFIFIGTSSGRIYIYEVNDVISNLSLLLKLKILLTDHDNYVNYIYICNKLNCVASVSLDKTCNLYTFPQMKLFRVIKIDTFCFDYVFMSINPLPCVILYSKSNLCFYSYSINGQLIHTETDGVKYLFSPMIMSDASHRDHLVYGTQYGELFSRPLPLFNGSWKISLNKLNEGYHSSSNLQIKCLDLSKDKRSIFYWQLENFNVSVIRDPLETAIKSRKISDENVNPLGNKLGKYLFEKV